MSSKFLPIDTVKVKATSCVNLFEDVWGLGDPVCCCVITLELVG